MHRPKVLQGSHNAHALFRSAKDHMLDIQAFSLGSAGEALGSVLFSIHQGQDAGICMLQKELLIIGFFPLDRLATSVIMAHKIWHNPLEAGTLTTKSFLSGAQRLEVSCSLWRFVCK